LLGLLGLLGLVLMISASKHATTESEVVDYLQAHPEARTAALSVARSESK